MAGVPKSVARESVKHKSDLVAVYAVRWDKGGSKPVDDYTLSYGNVNANEQAFSC